MLGIYRLFFDFLLEALDQDPELGDETRAALRSALGKHLCFDLGLVIAQLTAPASQASARGVARSAEPVAVAAAPRALAQGELVLHYQPLVALSSGAPIALEALLRWLHPQRGLLLPEAFLGDFEAAGLMEELTRWVLREALRQAGIWQRRLGRPMPVAINVPPALIGRDALVEWVAEALAESGAEAGQLEIEVPAPALSALVQQGTVLDALARQGVRLVVEDFASGTLPLDALEGLPITDVKIDRAVIARRAPEAAAHYLRVLVDLGHGLGYRVRAERVETRHQRALVEQAGCDAVQGYQVSRPQPAPRVTAWLDRATARS